MSSNWRKLFQFVFLSPHGESLYQPQANNYLSQLPPTPRSNFHAVRFFCSLMTEPNQAICSLFMYRANATAPIQDDLVLYIFIGFLFYQFIIPSDKCQDVIKDFPINQFII
jgi:hypothetical protein